MKKTILFLLLLSVISSSAQKMYVPFKIGSKYSIADYTGDLQTEAIYDDLTISRETKVLFFKRDTLAGLITNLKEVIIDNQYTEYYLKPNYILGWSLVNENIHLNNLFNLNGKKMLLDKYSYITVSENCKNCPLNFIEASYSKEGITYIDFFIYNNKKQKLEDIAITNAYRIQKIQSRNSNDVFFKINKNEIISYFKLVSNDDLVKLVDITQNSKEMENLEKNIEYYEVGIDEMVAPYPFTSLKYSKFYTKDNKYYLIKTNGNKKDTTFIKLPKKASEIKIIENQINYFTKKEKNTMNNFIEYKVNNKVGYLFTDSLQIEPKKYEYLEFFNSDLTSKTINAKSYIYAIKEKKTNKLKFGVNDILGSEIIKPIYDSISVDISEYNPKNNFFKNAKDYYKVYNGSKFGFLTTTGNEITPIKFNEIITNDYKNRYYFTNFSIVKSTDGYSVFTNSSYNRNEYLKYKFKYKPKFLITYFYGMEAHILFGLFNDNDEFMGYANENYVYFFKE